VVRESRSLGSGEREEVVGFGDGWSGGERSEEDDRGVWWLMSGLSLEWSIVVERLGRI
jgi:hypothetical protein